LSHTHHLSHITSNYRRFAWQAWHKLTSAALCVAGVAQTHIYHRFAWQAWHKLTSTVVLRGRRGSKQNKTTLRTMSFNFLESTDPSTGNVTFSGLEP